MKEIYDHYVEHSFGERAQSLPKRCLFEYNYRDYFPVNKSSPVLDLGVGRGEMLSCMRDWGYSNYIGIDISSSTIGFCQSIGLACSRVENTESWLNQNANRFAFITLLDVLEHIPRNKCIEFLKAIHTALMPDGLVIIQVPNLQSPDGCLHMYNDITHAVGYVEHSLGQVLQAAGFNVFEFQGFEERPPAKLRHYVANILRASYYAWVRFRRKITRNLNPEILTPVFFAVCRKTKPVK